MHSEAGREGAGACTHVCIFIVRLVYTIERYVVDSMGFIYRICLRENSDKWDGCVRIRGGYQYSLQRWREGGDHGAHCDGKGRGY